MTHPTPAQFTLKRSKGRKTQLYYGHQKPMDLSPRDLGYDALVARWNEMIFPDPQEQV